MPADSDHDDPTTAAGVVEARPVRTARIAVAAAAVVFVVMVVVALLEPSRNAGAHFDGRDQAFTVVIGLILAAGLLLPARPRLHADATGVRLRGFVGSWRTVPWDVVQHVEFPANARFARLVLPAEEIIAVVAVQRADRERSIVAMRGLRRLFADARAAAEAPESSPPVTRTSPTAPDATDPTD